MPEKINDNTREQIRADYVLMGSVNKVAKKHKVSWATVRSILDECSDDLDQIRIEKRKEFIEDAWDTAQIYLTKLKDPKTIKDTKARDAVIVYGTLVDKVQKDLELNIKIDDIFEQAFFALKEAIRKEIRKDKDLYMAFEAFANRDEIVIKNKAREMFENNKNELKLKQYEQKKGELK